MAKKTLVEYFKRGFEAWKTHGLISVMVCGAFVVMPRKFSLLISLMRRDSAFGSEGRTDMAYKSAADVLDYVDWKDMGGGTKPVASQDARDCYIWFTPDWRNVWGGGHYTLFRFAQHFAKCGNTRQIIYVYNNARHDRPDALQKELNDAFPDCKLEVVIDPKKLPVAKAALATTWQSAYDVRSFPFAEHKFYFMQDYESQFYAYGTASLQANNTYAFGFTGITGGHWLKRTFESYGGKAENYMFATDRSIFFPQEKDGAVRDKVGRIFFYGRPTTERRCFDLGIAALTKIAAKYPDIEIVIAGLDLGSPPPFKATLLGNLSLKATGDLYRSCDLGIAFSGTNLSYLPVELMASGVPVISNSGPQVDWFCTHMENSFLVDPTPEAILQAVEKLSQDKVLRQKLVQGGIAKTATVTWEAEMDKIFAFVQSSISEKAPLKAVGA